MSDAHPCSDLLDHLSDYLDGAAAQEICAEIEQHLADCENCRVVIDTLRQTVHLYHTLPAPALSEDARTRLYKTLNLSPYLNPEPSS
ncbi:MAG: zf-HC2 domain-containing protein [Chloroflexi bacterium]|nr:zf-HC2 domain-containing protein [Chloroflexota bacterium]